MKQNGANIGAMRVGGQTVSKAYRGAVEVWGNGPTLDDYFARYEFEDDLTDLTGQHHGTGSGIAYVAGLRSGTKGVQINSSDYISIADHDNFDLRETGTISVWVKFDSFLANNYQVIADKTRANGLYDSWLMYIDNRTPYLRALAFSRRNAGHTVGSTIIANGAIAGAGSWYHIAYTQDIYRAGDTERLFVNGVQVAGGNATYLTGINNLVPILGNASASINTLRGTMDDCRFYARCLSNAEIVALYTAG